MADEEKTTIYLIQDQPPSLICRSSLAISWRLALV